MVSRERIKSSCAVFRLIQSGFEHPHINMAVDQALFDRYSEGNIAPAFRIYGWQPSGYSCGYFQDLASVIDVGKCQRIGRPYVRRMTGGSVIYHKNDISYSLICSKDTLSLSGSVSDSYRHIAGFLIRFYRKLGLNPEFASAKYGLQAQTGFCFSSFENYDIKISGKKNCGSAQRRRKVVFFQHGSILLRDNPEGVNSIAEAGLEDTASLEGLTGRVVSYDQASKCLIESFKEEFSCFLEPSELSAAESKSAAYLREFKYSKDLWNIQRYDKCRNFKKTVLA